MAAKNTIELCRAAALKHPATDCIPLAQNARHMVDLLLERKLWMDAIAYLSHAIPPREDIWWGWFCARKAAQKKNDPVEALALSLVEKWIAQPTDENRAAAWKQAGKMPTGSPAHTLLEAVYWTGETENEATGEKIPAVPYISNKMVQGAVLGAVYELDAENPEPVAMEFIQQALEVTNRIQAWNQYS